MQKRGCSGTRRGDEERGWDVSCVPSRMREGATQEGGINSVARVSLRDTLSPFFSFAEEGHRFHRLLSSPVNGCMRAIRKKKREPRVCVLHF